MRITNVRRGRILRMAGLGLILLLILYMLHEWSNRNVVKEQESISLTDSKSDHRKVYPVLEKGKKINFLFDGIIKRLMWCTVICYNRK